MTDWELLHKSHWDTTERLEVPGGWLIRTVWRKHIEIGQPMLDGSAVVFVPMLVSERDARAARDAALAVVIEGTEDEETEDDAVEAEASETGREPEDIGIARQDPGPVRRRKSG